MEELKPTNAQHKTMESVLQRGEKLDTLVERSESLSAHSKAFYKTAKKVCNITDLFDIQLTASFQQNSCCTIM